jgi:predicted lipid-binding transport protein (Tim44 family)
MKMKKWQALAALLLVSLVAFAPSLAEARAGGSYRSSGGGSFSSQGSRGSQTYAPNGGSSMQRSMTPQSAPNSGYSGSGYGSGFASNHPFLTGLAGGFFGGWLGSMFFPHWGMGMGYGGGGFAGVLGSVFSWLLIIGLIWFAIRMFMRRAMPAGGADLGGLGMMRGMGYGGGAPPTSAPATTPLAIAQVDYQAFETVLKQVQAAWSKGDLAELRHVVTPEMLSYFAEELAENESQGVTNHVEQVELLRGDLRQAWDEGRLHYATCLLHWRALDYTVRNDRQHGDLATVVDGDARNPSEAAELWTFARSPGGAWLLSAIQQT